MKKTKKTISEKPKAEAEKSLVVRPKKQTEKKVSPFDKDPEDRTPEETSLVSAWQSAREFRNRHKD